MDSKPKRSKNGCETCRRRKVKCDETHPNCAACDRLHFTCRWTQEKKPPLKTIRRGYGPVKSRDNTWTPRAIVSIPPEPIIAGSSPETAGTMSTSSPESDQSNSTIGDVADETGEWPQDLDVDIGNLMLFTFSDDPFTFGESQAVGNCQEVVDFEQLFTGHPSGSHQISNSRLDLFPVPSLSDFHIQLPNSLTLCSSEHEVLRHYQTTYSLYRTTKDPNWSTHKVLLRIGSQNTMIMHLILAVSLNDYSLRTGNNSHALAADSHFQAGARLFISISTTSSKTDDVLVMAAYFFIYLYMTKRKSIAPQQLNQLSSTVLAYVQRRDLVTSCISPTSLTDKSDGQSVVSSHHRSLLARLIMWTLDEDVKCGFQANGGHFARYLANRDSRTKEIYDASRNALGDHWGTEYPHSQALDDDQNSTVLEFLWALMPLWQDINDLDRISESSDLKSRIEQKFLLLEEKYSSVFRHSSETTKPRPRILVNADYDVVLFNALRVYYFRSTLSDLTIETPLEIQNSLKTILAIIQRTFSSRSTELHDRLQWPLFLAGIETTDTIYREWIFSRLTTNRVAVALQQALDAQAISGKRLSMAEIRDLLYNGTEPSLFGADVGYLADIAAV